MNSFSRDPVLSQSNAFENDSAFHELLKIMPAILDSYPQTPNYEFCNTLLAEAQKLRNPQDNFTSELIGTTTEHQEENVSDEDRHFPVEASNNLNSVALSSTSDASSDDIGISILTPLPSPVSNHIGKSFKDHTYSTASGKLPDGEHINIPLLTPFSTPEDNHIDNSHADHNYCGASGKQPNGGYINIPILTPFPSPEGNHIDNSLKHRDCLASGKLPDCSYNSTFYGASPTKKTPILLEINANVLTNTSYRKASCTSIAGKPKAYTERMRLNHLEERRKGLKPKKRKKMEIPHINKRFLHNDMEKKRRIDLTQLFRQLQQVVIPLADGRKATKLVILKKTKEYIHILDADQNKLRKDKAILLQKNIDLKQLIELRTRQNAGQE